MAETERISKGKVVLVTGASRGIGQAAALEAARRGAHVIAVARTVGGLEDLDDEIQAMGSSTTLVPLDLTDCDAIDRLGAAIFERWGHLDGLIGNAGLLGTISPLPHLDPKEFEKVFAVNVTANYPADPLARPAAAAGGGRAVRSSFLRAPREAPAPIWGLYAATKAALDTLIKSYAGEMAQTTVRANIFYPGIVRTAMRAKAMPGEDPETLPLPSAIAPQLVDMISPDFAGNGQLYNAADGSTQDL